MTSSYEIEIQKFLTDNNINFTTHNRELLLGQELDLYINDYNIGIEFNGDYWHSSLYKNKNYHLDKSKLAKEAGIRLIHIWEYEWRDVIKQEIIKSIILTACGIVSKKIFARKCHVKQISNSVAKIFLQKNHLFGYRAANLTYGLYYDNELVQIMSFSRNKYNKNIKNSTTWEIIRSCTKINTVVIGGINKILKKFISSNDVSIIFSYCDFNKFDGKGYAAANMEFIGYTGPNLLWLFEDHVVKNRNPKTHAFDQQNSIAKIWQAGSLKYQINIIK